MNPSFSNSFTHDAHLFEDTNIKEEPIEHHHQAQFQEYASVHTQERLLQQNMFENVRCVMGNNCFQLCTSKTCEQQAIVCNDKSCECRKKHNMKGKICFMIDPDRVVDLLQNKKNPQLPIKQQINSSFDDLIQWLLQEKQKFLKKTELSGLNTKELKFLEDCHNKKLESFTGKEISEVIEDISEDKEKVEEMKLKISQTIQKEWKCVLASLKLNVQRLEKNMNLVKAVRNDIQSSSRIIHKKLHKKRLQELLTNKDQKAPIEFKLLYRASENGFLIDKFWEKCNGATNTLTLVKTKSNKIFGGYTPLKWDKQKHPGFQVDSKCESFLFSVSQNAKFALKQDSKTSAIYHSLDYGVIFGGGHDLVIHNKSNLHDKSCALIGDSYSNPGYPPKKKETYQSFVGSNNGEFSTEEWEVLQVNWEV